jgi:hypothetical protein
MTRPGRVVGHRILARALLPSYAIPYTDSRPNFLRHSCERLSSPLWGVYGIEWIWSHHFWSIWDFVASDVGLRLKIKPERYIIESSSVEAFSANYRCVHIQRP